MARRKGREIEVRVYLNKAMVDSFDMTTTDMPLERIVQQVATISQSVSDVKVWLKATTNVPIRPLWGSLWAASLRPPDKQQHEIVRLASMDNQDSVQRSQIVEAYELAVRSMADASESLACVWRALEHGHTRIAMKHIWHALLGAVGLPNTSYMDKLPDEPKEAKTERRAHAKAKAASEITEGIVVQPSAESGGQGHSKHGQKSGIAEDATERKLTNADTRKGVNVQRATHSDRHEGRGRGSREKVGGKLPHKNASKDDRDKVSVRDVAKADDKPKKIGVPPSDRAKPDGAGNKRPYPFAVQGESDESHKKVRGKPPPPIAVDEDTDDEDKVLMYKTRLEKLKLAASSANKTAADGDGNGKAGAKVGQGAVRLTPVPPKADGPLRGVGWNNDDACAAAPTPWWGSRSSDIPDVNAPWRRGKAVPNVTGENLATVYPGAKGGPQGQRVPKVVAPPPKVGFQVPGQGGRCNALDAQMAAAHGFWSGSFWVPVPPKASTSRQTSTAGKAALPLPKLPPPVYPKHGEHDVSGSARSDNALAVNACSSSCNYTIGGLRVPVPPKDGGCDLFICSVMHVTCDVQLFCCGCLCIDCTCATCMESGVGKRLYVSGHVIQVFCLGCVNRMHCTGYIVGTDGVHHQWYPFREQGRGEDGASTHVLQNTHDLRALFDRHCLFTIQEAYEDAWFGFLRPRHVLCDDHRQGIVQQLEELRRLVVQLELDPAYHMNSDTETIGEDVEYSPSTSLAVHSGSCVSDIGERDLDDPDEGLGRGCEGTDDVRLEAFGHFARGSWSIRDVSEDQLSCLAEVGDSTPGSSVGSGRSLDGVQTVFDNEHFEMIDRGANYDSEKEGSCVRRDARICRWRGLSASVCEHGSRCCSKVGLR
eukprot:6455183-Amphidinium_carterae.1